MRKDGFWEKELETISRKDLEKLQVERLKKTIERALDSPFYSRLYAANGITPDSVNSIEDIRKIPFTVKEDMRNNYPFGMVSGSLDKAVRLHSSSGTTGNPTVIFHRQPYGYIPLAKRFGYMG